jgi:glutamate 5-kinase
MSDARHRLPVARRVVVKVGTAVVARPDGGLALGRVGALVEQLHALRQNGTDVLLVSSGAVGLGAARLGFDRRPVRVVDRQACAAAGQGALMAFYDGLFSRLGGQCAQVLLAEEDFHFRQRFNNLTATLERLLELRAVPIINENDTLSTAELALEKGAVFGDNDRLSALVAAYLNADALVVLSDVDGVYTRPPTEPGATRISEWGEGSTFEEGDASANGRGGMGSKIAAASLAARSGVTAVIASGNAPSCVERVLRGDDVGTVFAAAPGLRRRKAWLAFATAPSGVLEVNVGARAALVERGASLLVVGVTGVTGAFIVGDVVRITLGGVELARGVVAQSAEQVRAALASPPVGRGRPLVHRDDLVIT